jgi:hypothetical protein
LASKGCFISNANSIAITIMDIDCCTPLASQDFSFNANKVIVDSASSISETLNLSLVQLSSIDFALGFATPAVSTIKYDP